MRPACSCISTLLAPLFLTSPPAASSPDLEDKLRRQAEDALVPRPTKQQLFRLWLCTAIPFIGFGFIDNLVMVSAHGHWLRRSPMFGSFC